MNYLKYIRYFTCLPLILLSSCASIIHGTRQSVGISSYPTNAEVWVDNKFIGRSPAIVELTRKDNHVVKIMLDGYQPYEAVLTHEISGWVFGNIVFGGLIGLAVDAISGGLYQLTPDQVQVEMHREKMASSKKSDELYIAAVMIADPTWKKIGHLEKVN